MILGNINRINLSTSFFERLIAENCLYVDKTRFIENFLNMASDVLLITRQRRLGKSLNMDMLRCFLTSDNDYRYLFKGTYIETSPAWEKANSAPAFIFDFKSLRSGDYEEQIYEQSVTFAQLIAESENLTNVTKRKLQRLVNGKVTSAECIFRLSELVHLITSKKPYIFIDEYDSLLIKNFGSEKYDEIRLFLTDLISAAMKGNPHLQKALITGVMRISYESMFSGLNNIVSFDMFNDNVFTDDYGFTEAEARRLCELAYVNIDEVRDWYNGVRVCGQAIFSTFSTLNYIDKKVLGCYWGKSGNLEMIMDLLTDRRRDVLTTLLNDGRVTVSVDSRISLKELFEANTDEAFYSLLVQGGYLAHEKDNPASNICTLYIPNTELRIVWQSFILNKYFPSHPRLRTIFANANDMDAFAVDLERFLQDRLSFHDLAVYQGENPETVHERVYHIYMLGILAAYDDTRYKPPSSNRESGRGRYDILVEKHEANYIFEFKGAKSEKGLARAASNALRQIDEKRYGGDLSIDKPIVKVGIAIFGKSCKVKARFAEGVGKW